MLAIAGGKGGVGKTTTALGLAIAFAGQRRRPLLVDLDVDMPDISTLTGLSPEPGLAAVTRGADPERVARPDSNGFGISVLPTSPGTDRRNALSRLPVDRPVILDCPPGASEDSVQPIAAADRVVLVTTPDRQAIEDAVKTAAVAQAVQTTVAAVVVTRSESPPSGLGAALQTDVIVSVPAVIDEPLENAGVRESYDYLASALRGKD